MDHQNIIKNKSVLSMNIECRGFDWSNGEVIRSELIKFNDSNITW